MDAVLGLRVWLSKNEPSALEVRAQRAGHRDSPLHPMTVRTALPACCKWVTNYNWFKLSTFWLYRVRRMQIAAFLKSSGNYKHVCSPDPNGCGPAQDCQPLRASTYKHTNVRVKSCHTSPHGRPMFVLPSALGTARGPCLVFSLEVL